MPKVTIIQTMPDRECEECGVVEECRPYGKGGKWICYDCGMKDEVNTNKMMNSFLFGQ